MTTEQVKRRGRPRAPEKGSAVTTWIPEREHDRIATIANRTGMSVSAVVRSLLAKQANGTETPR